MSVETGSGKTGNDGERRLITMPINRTVGDLNDPSCESAFPKLKLQSNLTFLIAYERWLEFRLKPSTNVLMDFNQKKRALKYYPICLLI